jgi:hypothetical protein
MLHGTTEAIEIYPKQEASVFEMYFGRERDTPNAFVGGCDVQPEIQTAAVAK